MSEGQRRYRVVIPYREPTYEVHTGKPRKHPYNAPYVVTAGTAEEATNKALELFKSDARNSHVGWQRVPEFEGIKVTLIKA